MATKSEKVNKPRTKSKKLKDARLPGVRGPKGISKLNKASNHSDLRGVLSCCEPGPNIGNAMIFFSRANQA
jgi:hypothetical protein